MRLAKASVNPPSAIGAGSKFLWVNGFDNVMWQRRYESLTIGNDTANVTVN
jgi:hypothetical protein